MKGMGPLGWAVPWALLLAAFHPPAHAQRTTNSFGVRLADMYGNCSPDDKKPCVPSVDWAQDKEEVWVVVLATCAEESRDVVISEQHLSFKCTSPEGIKFEVAFQLRGDVETDAAKSFCKQTALSDYGGNVFEKCNLRKTQEHFFDQLMGSSDNSRLKKYHNIQWKMVSAKKWDFEAASKNVLEGYADIGRVKEATPELLDTWRNASKKKRKSIILDVQYPWCDKCSSQMETFQKASGRLKSTVNFGYVDAREYPDLREEFGKKLCDHTCEYTLLKSKGEKWSTIKVKSKTNTKDLLKEIEDSLAPITKTLKSLKKLRKYTKKHEVVVAGYFTKNSNAKRAFMKVATELKKKLKFVTLKWTKSESEPANWAKAEAGADKRALIYLRGRKRKRVFEGAWEKGSGSDGRRDFRKWVDNNRIAPLQKYHFDLRTPAKAAEYPVGLLFLEVDSSKQETPDELLIDKYLALYDELEAAGSPINILWADKSSDYMMADYGLDKKKKPAFVMADNFDTDSKKYAYTKRSDGSASGKSDISKNIDEIKKFIQRVADGSEPRAYKSAAVPTEAYERGKVQKVVGKTQHTVFTKKDETFVVMLYKEHSTDKDKYIAAFKKYAALFKNVDKVTFAMFDTGNNYADWAFFEGVKKDSKCKFVALTPEAPGSDAPIVTTFPETKKNGLQQGAVLAWLKSTSKYLGRQWDIVQAAVDGKEPPTAQTRMEFKGCYTDMKDRDLPLAKGTRTREQCARQCRADGYKYFGQQYRSQCRCGHTFGRYGPTSGCHQCEKENPALSHNYGSWKSCVWQVRNFVDVGASAEEMPAETQENPDDFETQKRREKLRKQESGEDAKDEL